MTHLQQSAVWPEDFCGSVKLFPLPNLVLFPQVVQPLHVFEPRYCTMLADSLATDQLLAMATLAPNWESHYEQRPPIAKTVCVGKIISHSVCDGDSHNILLVGMKRARVLRELESDLLYRTADVELLEDVYPEEESLHRPSLIEKLQELFSQHAPGGWLAQESFSELVGRQLPLGVLTDLIAYAVNLPIAIKLQLLTEQNVDIRCRMLTRCLEQKIVNGLGPDENQSDSQETKEKFPPKFSNN
jgi:ATP-dependent Lon protease